jgi:hypothetical protein
VELSYCKFEVKVVVLRHLNLLEVLEHSEGLLDAMSDPRPKGFGREDVQGGPIKLPPKRYNCQAEVFDALIEGFVQIVHLDEVSVIATGH